MRWLETDPKVETYFASGILRVSIREQWRWLLLVLGIAVPATILYVLLWNWQKLSTFLRIGLTLGLIADFGTLIYRLTGQEVIEFGAQTLSVRKEMHGWERRLEYSIDACHELEWISGSEGVEESLQCWCSKKRVRFGQGMSEKQANEVFVLLQTHLPEVAQKVFSSPEEESSILGPGLS